MLQRTVLCISLCTGARVFLESERIVESLTFKFLNRFWNKSGSRKGNKDTIMFEWGLEFPQNTSLLC